MAIQAGKALTLTQHVWTAASSVAFVGLLDVVSRMQGTMRSSKS